MTRRIIFLAVLQAAAIQLFGGQEATPRPLKFGAAIQRDVRSGEVQEYSLTADAGDLLFGTIEVRRLSALVEFMDKADDVVSTVYFFGDEQPAPRRIGFVASAGGSYRVRIKAVERFDSGPQWALGELVPIVGATAGSYTLQLDRAAVAARMQAVQPAVREERPSPRLARLTQELREGRSEALQSFWREVAGKGPIIQEIPGNNREQDVTFLWREIYDTRNVLLAWCPRLADCYMSRLPGTDVWHKTIRLRRGTRIEYRISPNDRPEDRWATGQLDPLNPRKFPDDPTYPFSRESVLETTGAPDEHWALREPARRGRIEEKKIASALLGREHDIWIYTPPGYESGAGPYPFLLLLDGAVYVSNRFLNAPTTLDNLINDGRIPPVIVCFDPANRDNTQAVAGGEPRYSQFVAQELMPMLRASYPISTKPADQVIGGFSAGGRTASKIAFFHSDMFGNVLSQSGSFRASDPGADEPNSDAQAYLAAPRKPIRFYIEVGLYDIVPAADLPIHDLVLDETNLMGNRHLRDVLRAKGYDVTYREVGGGHANIHWRAMLADGLMTLLGLTPK